VAVEPGKQAMPNRRLKPDSPRFIRKLFIILWERAFFISYGHPPIGNHAWFMAGSIGTLNPSESPPLYPGVGKSLPSQLQTVGADYDSDLCRRLARYKRASDGTRWKVESGHGVTMVPESKCWPMINWEAKLFSVIANVRSSIKTCI